MMIWYAIIVAIHEQEEHPLEIRKINVVEGIGCGLSNYTIRANCRSKLTPNDYKAMVWDKPGDFPRWAVVMVHDVDDDWPVVEMIQMVDCLEV